VPGYYLTGIRHTDDLGYKDVLGKIGSGVKRTAVIDALRPFSQSPDPLLSEAAKLRFVQLLDMKRPTHTSLSS
jgi:hypothetical protein